MTYTSAQKSAIDEITHPLQLIACAGSGKTQVISQRISHILAQPGIHPRNVVAFTFTEKAAAELKERVHAIVRAEHGDVLGMAEMFIGTMHGYCLNLLQTYIPEAFKFSVLTEITQRLLIDRNSKASGLTTCPTTSVQGHLRRYQNSKLYMQALSILQEDDVDFELIPDGVDESLHAYLQLIAKRNYFDYTAMVATAVDLLETDADETEDMSRLLLQHVKDDVRYVVVDEYQDLNPLQERLVAALVRYGANLCVVGDDDQTIYQWRGSEVSHILDFANNHEEVRAIELADNFRSSKGIVELGRAVAERIPSAERLTKRMEYASHQQWERGDMLALEFGDAKAEALWIVGRLEQLRGLPFQDDPGSVRRGLSWSDCAVLFRSVKDAGPLVEVLRARGIPYIIKGLARLFDAPEIIAVVGLFRYLQSEIDSSELRALWATANVIPRPERFSTMLRRLDAARRFDGGDRWGLYNIQRLYLEVLEILGIREDTIPGTPERAELVMYELGKFSQVISDFETIYFASEPERKYESFLGFLTYQAPTYYEESDEEASYATPDAVTISTVHRAKGMQWPAVFVPALRKNRFPAARVGGLNVFHVIPVEAVPHGDRYRGGLSEETRLFYVALTRAKKYLYMTWAPGDAARSKNVSEFFTFATKSSWVSTRDSGLAGSERLTPTPKLETPAVNLSFSELKYLFECPYQFKLRFMYGFNPPLDEAIGYGKGLHDALAEMHKRAIAGDVPTRDEAVSLVDRHLHTPYAYPALREQLHRAAVDAIERYFDVHGEDLTRTIHSEKEIAVTVGPGVTVDGRIDLIKKLETNETSIVDFKSTSRAQPENVTRDQLHVYALGYEELTGARADLVEVLNLDEEGKNVREEVDERLLDGIRDRILAVADDIRANRFVCSHDHSKDGFDDLRWLVEGGRSQ
ncbi:ATP-dependent helicase [Rathayibacter soli]|uniref:ATP-dependent helicase n=1 Tax=Rathayibacter soli TaxID=3144168 RepID=UPI0027E3D67F|nr:ATP-dependent DNA helicase [Glaciibacter superstes]